MSKTQDQKSSPAINPLSISHFFKKKKLHKKPPRIRSAKPDHSPSLTKDEKGNLYLVWEHGNELWWAVNKGNDWKNHGTLTEDGGTNPIVMYEKELFNYGPSEGLVCIWESLDTPHRIMQSIGKPTQDGIIWSKPHPVTSDAHDDYGLAMVMEKNSHPLILWLQNDTSKEDDSDLYYQVFNINNLQPLLPLEKISSPRNQDQSEESPFLPFVNSTCIERTLFSGGSLIPRFIPIFGGGFNYSLLTSICSDFTEIPSIAASLPDYDPNETLYPLYLQDLTLEIFWGRRIRTQNIFFALTESVVEKDKNDQYIMTEQVYTFGGDFLLDLLSLPIPLFIGFLPVGRTRLAIDFALGADINFVDYVDQYSDSNANVLSQINTDKDFSESALFDQNYPLSLSDIDLSQIDEVDFLFEISMGAGGGFSAFRGLLQGRIIALGGVTTKQIYPCYPSDYVYEYVREPFALIAGIIRCGGSWNGILHVFERSIGSINIDPNSLYRPATFRTASKDKLLKRNFHLMEDKTPVYEAFESFKKAFQGTGSIYEGKPVLTDISKDVYSDGLPDLAKSGSGEILVAWTKGFASSCLGGKVYVAEYNRDSWTGPVAVTPDNAFCQQTALVFDSHSNPMLLWSSASNKGLDYEQSSVEEILMAMDKADLMYAQRIEGIWTPPQKVAVLSGKDEQVRVASGPQGEITAVWINQTNRLSTVYSSFWNGKGWSNPSPLSRASLAESPQVIYTAGKPMVLWSQDEDGSQYTFDDWSLYFSLWDGSSWSSPRPLFFNEKQLLTSRIKKNLHKKINYGRIFK